MAPYMGVKWEHGPHMRSHMSKATMKQTSFSICRHCLIWAHMFVGVQLGFEELYQLKHMDTYQHASTHPRVIIIPFLTMERKAQQQ